MAQSPLAYALKPGEKMERGFKRVLRRMAVRARRLPRGSRSNIGESIHDARTLIKRLRALLRFARPVLDRPALVRAKAQLRRAARLLAATRDQAAARSTLSKLTQKTTEPRDRKALAQACRAFAGNFRSGRDKEKAQRDSLQKATDLLLASIDAIEKSPSSGGDWPSSAERVDRAFHLMRQAGKRALDDGKALHFHEWRKKAKSLLYQLELTQFSPERRMAQTLKRVDALQDTLGAYHDCVVTEDHLRLKFQDPPATRRISVLLKKRRARLQKRARKIAQSL